MRAHEFITEEQTKGHNGGKISHNAAKAAKGHHNVRDDGGYDRTYHLNRLAMAMAMADGSSKKPVDMGSSSFVEKYNTIHPYTEQEHNMLHQAMGAVPTDHQEVVGWSKSEEPDDIHKASPVKPRRDYRKK
jgi:hypothetical protein